MSAQAISPQPGEFENSNLVPCEINSTNYVQLITSENIKNLSCGEIRFRIEIIKEKMTIMRDELQKIKSKENPYENLPSVQLIQAYTKVITEIKKTAEELRIIFMYNQSTKVLTVSESQQIEEILKALKNIK